MKILDSEDYSASTVKLCAYSFAAITLYPIVGLLSVGVREVTNKGFIVALFRVIDMFVSFLPFPISILGVIAAMLAISKGHSRKKAVIGGLGNAAAFSVWFFVLWILLSR